MDANADRNDGGHEALWDRLCELGSKVGYLEQEHLTTRIAHVEEELAKLSDVSKDLRVFKVLMLAFLISTILALNIMGVPVINAIIGWLMNVQVY